MMIKIILISVFVTATVNAVSEKNDDNANDQDFTFPKLTFPQLPNFPKIPDFPPLTIPALPDFPSFPTIQMPSFKFPEIKFPNPEDITKHKERDYYGVSVIQNSDGTTTMITNTGGVITRQTVPDSAKESALEKSKNDLEKST